MHFKEELYEQYYETHVLPRSGQLSVEKLKKKQKVFDQHFGELLPPNLDADIIDAGCGSGSLVYWLQKKGYTNACGVDGGVGQIEEGRTLGVNNLETGELVSYLGARSEAYDCIFLRDVVEHFNKEDVLSLLKVCRSSLRPGGRLVIQVPNGASPFVGRILFGDFTHETAYTDTSLAQLFGVCGYQDFCAKPFSPVIRTITWRSLFSKSGRRAVVRRLSWGLLSRIYDWMLFAEIGSHTTVVTFNIIATAIRPK